MKAFQLQPFIFKNNSMNPFLNWRVTRYIFLFILIALPVSSLSIIGYKSETVFLAARVVQLLLFISLGIVHSDSLEKRPLFTHHSIREKFYFSFVLTLVIYGVLLLFYFMVRSNLQRMAMASSCAFLLPFVVIQSWNYYLMIFEHPAMIWYGYTPVADNADIVYLNTILINIRLSRKYEAKEETSFLINTPLNLELGKLFNSFLHVEKKNDNDDIECMAENNKPFGWKFYVVSFGGLYKKLLDPSKSLQCNKNIRRKATILAKRVSA